jgi:hypothetical protein
MDLLFGSTHAAADRLDFFRTQVVFGCYVPSMDTPIILASSSSPSVDTD